jgi:hypothetical protein|tara:strand:- start:62 stop:211 length:150 start_codon:yes stop_codon:yes gene_type:complete
MSAADNIILAALAGLFWIVLPWVFIRKDLDLHTKSPNKAGLNPQKKERK